MAHFSDHTIPNLKLTLVGDGGIGKSCLILQYLYGDFVEEYEPTKADAYRKKISLLGEECQVDILDTAGQEDYPALKDRYLKHGDGYLLIFDMTNQETFQSLKTHRENILRIKSDVTNLPIILVGNKKDLNKFRTVSFDEASNLAKKWHLIYIETSAKTRENVDKAFSEILIKIKENKMLNPTTTSIRNDSQSLSSTINEIKNQKTYVSSNNLTKKEEEELRAHSTKKRVKKFYQNFKKKCILS